MSISPDRVVVRARQGLLAGAATERRSGLRALAETYSVVRFADAHVEVLRSKVKSRGRSVRDVVRSTLSLERGVQFVDRVLRDRGTQDPVLYTENLFVQFEDFATTPQRRKCRGHANAGARSHNARRAWVWGGGSEGRGLFSHLGIPNPDAPHTERGGLAERYAPLASCSTGMLIGCCSVGDQR